MGGKSLGLQTPRGVGVSLGSCCPSPHSRRGCLIFPIIFACHNFVFLLQSF